jgi:hypothetical protein
VAVVDQEAGGQHDQEATEKLANTKNRSFLGTSREDVRPETRVVADPEIADSIVLDSAVESQLALAAVAPVAGQPADADSGLTASMYG